MGMYAQVRSWVLFLQAMASCASTISSRYLGASLEKASSAWYTPHMAAASRAILHRIPLVDFVVEVRDARIPLSSGCEYLRNFPSSRHMVVLNKMDLANGSQTKEWLKYFQEKNCVCYGVNSHNKGDIHEFLNILQAQVRELKKFDQLKFTTSVMLLGKPNVGKSAMASALHKIGRVRAVEKGKLKHAIVSPQPGETKNITSFKVGSHPNIYILDTPGVLPPQILDGEVSSKLALTGAISDHLVGEYDLARYLLAIVNSSEEYKHWKMLMSKDNEICLEDKIQLSGRSESVSKRKKLYDTDHTQDHIVRDVRKTIFETISSFKGNLEVASELDKLIEAQFMALSDPFHVSMEQEEKRRALVAKKLLNLYRTGRLGHYTLDYIP